MFLLFVAVFSSASMAAQAPQAQSVKKKIGVIATLSKDASKAKTVFPRIAEKFTEGFFNSKRFNVVDRSNNDLIQFERKIQKGIDFVNSEIAKQGASLALEIIVIGTVNNANTVKNLEYNPKAIFPGDKYWGEIEFSLKAINVVSTEVMAIKNFTIKGSGDSPDGVNSEIVAQIVDIVTNWARSLNPYYYSILSYESNVKKKRVEEITIEGGHVQGVSVGQTLVVIMEENVKSAETGKAILIRKSIAVLNVKRVDTDYAVCEVTEGGRNLYENKESGIKFKITEYY